MTYSSEKAAPVTISLSYVIAGAVFLLFLGDAATKYFFAKGMQIKVSLYFRLLFEIFVLFVIIRHLSRRQIENLIFIVLIALSYLVMQTIMFDRFPQTYHYNSNLILLNKYLYIFLIYIFFRVQHLNMAPLVRVVSAIFIINAWLIIAGAVFEIGLFKTAVEKDYRWGYSGLIAYAANEATYIIIFSIAFFYFRTFFTEQKSAFSFLLILFASLLVGQKSVYLFLLLLLLFHMVYFFSWKKIHYYLILLILVIVAVVEFVESAYFEKYFFYFIHALEKLDWITVMLGGRNLILETKIPLILEKWNILNYIFGGKDNEINILETDPFDLFFGFGIVGTALYIFLFYKFYIFQKRGKFLRFFVFTIILISTFAGHFLNSPNVALYFNILVLYFYTYQHKRGLLSYRRTI